ncbi:MAG: HAD family hydrolase [Nitrososphaerales archaeon]
MAIGKTALVFIFDIGGAVIKWPNNDPIFRSIADFYGIRFGEMKDALASNFVELEAGRITSTEWINNALSAVGQKKKKPNRLECERLLLEPFASKAKPRLGVIKLINSLKRRGYKVYALTNTSEDHLEYMKERGWLQYFERAFASCELGCLKPDAKIFGEMLRQAQATANQTVFIDDKPQNISGARNFGIRWTIKFESIGRLKKDIARIIRRSEMKD